MNTTKSLNPHILWILTHYLTAAAILAVQLIFIAIYGWKIFIILFETKKNIYYIIILLIIDSLLVNFLYNAVHRTKMLKGKTPFLSGIFNKIIAIPILIISIYTAVYLPIQHAKQIGGKSPSASEKFSFPAGPYIQFGPFKDNRAESTSKSMIIWYFDKKNNIKPAYLIYGRQPDLKNSKKIIEQPCIDMKRHEFQLSGLSPLTQYYYSIPLISSKIYHFHTGPGKDRTAPFRFLALGDSGNTSNGGYSYSYYSNVLRSADIFYKRINDRPAFKMHLGDIVRKGIDLKAWEVYFESERNHCSNLPCMLTLGNHEFLGDYGGNFDYFLSHPKYYSFDYGNAHFLVIHPFDGIIASADGPVVSTGKEQYKFIKEDLAKNINKKWTIVSIHIPVLSTGDYNINEILLKQFLRLFRKYRVDLVISGHDHNFDSYWLNRESEWGGTLYIVCGTGGSRIDDYIMTRKLKKWNAWFHDRSSEFGLYQDDEITRENHIYGELSWGFLDIYITKDSLDVSYYRWLNFDRFLEITEQAPESWSMLPIDENKWKENNLSDAVLVKKLSKSRTFY